MSANFVPLVPSHPDGILRVVNIGRKSKPNPQNDNESIDASHEDAEGHLHRAYKGPVEILRLGEQISGMIADRATIRQVEDLIAMRKVDLVLTEDLGRIFRNPRHMYAFVQDCVDADVRLIAVADNLDTADENWETALSLAAVRHGFAVPDAKRRVGRSGIYSFRAGRNVQKIRWGYRKLTREQALSGDSGPPGLQLVKIDECTPIIREICDKVKDIEKWRSYDDIAKWLNARGIMPGPFVTSASWTGRLVADFVKDELLMGVRSFRKTLSKRIYGSGKHKSRRNPNGPEKVRYAELAHLTPEEFEELQHFVRLRASRQRVAKGAKHPRYNVPRHKAICPSQHMKCGCCRQLYYPRAKGLFKCRCAFKHVNTCWNRVEVNGQMAREMVVGWTLDQLDTFPDFRKQVIDVACAEFERLRSRQHGDRAMWEQRISVLDREVKRLVKAVRKNEESESLQDELKEAEKQLTEARAELNACLLAEQTAGGFLDRADIEQRFREAILLLSATSFRFADFLREILVRFEIHPIQAVDSGLVRPRGHLTLAVSVTDSDSETGTRVQEVHGVLDLFEPPEHIRHLKACVAARKQRDSLERPPSFKAIARILGINYMTVKRALELARQMKAEGLSEPYRELTSPPSAASRWRSRKEA